MSLVSLVVPRCPKVGGGRRQRRGKTPPSAARRMLRREARASLQRDRSGLGRLPGTARPPARCGAGKAVMIDCLRRGAATRRTCSTPARLRHGVSAGRTADTPARPGSSGHGRGKPRRPLPEPRFSAIQDRALDRKPCSVEDTLARRSTLSGAFAGSGPPVRDGNTSGDSPDRLRARSSTSSAPLLSGTANSRPAFILEGGIVHRAAPMSISSHRAPRASPGRTAVSTISSTHRAAEGCVSVVRRSARSAAATSPCGSARWWLGPLPFAFGNASTARSTGLSGR